MAGPSIIDSIFAGIVTIDTNVALQGLAKVFVPLLILGQCDLGMLARLSIALNPVYIGLLFAILAYIGVAGTVKSAMDGEFLGRQWNSFGVPAMFMVCIILLAPVPTKGMVTLGQYTFIRGLIFGSNFADFMLKQAFVNAAATSNGTIASKVFLGSANKDRVQQVNNRMKDALAQYVCAEHITGAGYGSQAQYFMYLSKVCKISTPNVGMYTPFFRLADGNFVGSKVASINNINGAFGTNYANSGFGFSTGSITSLNNAGSRSLGQRELACYFSAFEANLSSPLPGALAAPLGLQPWPSIVSPARTAAPQPGAITPPDAVSKVSIDIHEQQLVGAWAKTLATAFECVMGSGIVIPPIANAAPSTSDPWSKGWVHASMSISDDNDDFATANALRDLNLDATPIASPDPLALGTSITDKENQVLLTKTLSKVKAFVALPKLNEIGEQLAGLAGSHGIQGAVDTTMSFASSDVTKAALTTVGIVAARNVAAFTGPPSPTARNALFMKFINTKGGAAATLPLTAASSAIGIVSKQVILWTKKLRLAFNVVEKGFSVAEKTADRLANQPLVGAIVAIGGAVASALSPGPLTLMIIGATLFLFSIVQLLPQVVLIVVMLLWLAKAAVWFMIIPLATVLIALPDTRVGHDIWKSALAIILTPVISLMFYFVSLYLSDVMYAEVIQWIFERYINDNVLVALLEIVKDLIFGDLLYRFVIGIGLIVAVFLYMNMMILRGTDLVTRSLGLSSSSGDLGDGMNSALGNVGHKIEGLGKNVNHP